MTNFDEELDRLTAKIMKRTQCTFDEAVRAARRVLEKKSKIKGIDETLRAKSKDTVTQM